jgi:hypothetical protein
MDMGRVIGRQGATAQAIRTILHQYGGVAKKRISLVINEPEGSERRPRPAFDSDRELLAEPA